MFQSTNYQIRGRNKIMRQSVSEIFDERPVQWGFRGDPYLWDEMAKSFSTIDITCSKSQFTVLFKEFFLELTNHAFEGDYIFVEDFAHGGMSSGMVSIEFWKEKGLPLLLERLERE